MAVTVVVGAQWGDEAKGKIVDMLSEGAEIVARFNGGDNAGHTVINPYGTFKLRLTPNGFSHPNTTCIIGPGVVLNLKTLGEEVDEIQGRGIDLLSRLWLSPRCHVVMPYHPLLDEAYESARGAGKTGTTRRGMGPVYADKVSYNGIRLADLLDREAFATRLGVQLGMKNPILQAFGYEPLEARAVEEEILARFEPLRAAVREPFGLLQEALRRDAKIVLEAAQAALLDTDWGTYPFCTASTTLASGATAGLGIAPRWISRVIGVAKAYQTRVGAGPMPTELLDETGELIRQQGAEFGTVTGRPRRCGWLDAAALAFTCQLNGTTDLALTKLDVLDKLPTIKICTGYRRPGEGERAWQYWEGDARWLEGCQPRYIELPGWQQPTTGVRRFEDLPAQAQTYVRAVEELAGTRISYVSTGPGRDEIIPLN